MAFRIDVATRADRPEVARLLAASYPVLLKPDYPAEVLTAALPHVTAPQDALLNSGTYYMVRDQEGIAVGAGGWTRARPGNEPARDAVTGHIRHVVTDPNRQREGIGRALMAHIFQTARTAGIQTLECYSTLNARAFYAAFGFEEIKEFTLQVGPGVRFPSVHMIAPIA